MKVVQNRRSWLKIQRIRSFAKYFCAQRPFPIEFFAHVSIRVSESPADTMGTHIDGRDAEGGITVWGFTSLLI